MGFAGKVAKKVLHSLRPWKWNWNRKKILENKKKTKEIPYNGPNTGGPGGTSGGSGTPDTILPDYQGAIPSNFQSDEEKRRLLQQELDGHWGEEVGVEEEKRKFNVRWMRVKEMDFQMSIFKKVLRDRIAKMGNDA